MSANNLKTFQDLYERDEEAAHELLGELHDSDPAAYFEIVNWYVDLVPVPSAREASTEHDGG